MNTEEEKSNSGRLFFKQPPVFLKMLNRELCHNILSVAPVTFFIRAWHMQILPLGPCGQGGNGMFIVEAWPANAISGQIKWERCGERQISIFYELFPLLPLGSLWLSAHSRLPSPLIPFSKNVIRKSPFGLSAATLSSCAGWAAHSYITARFSLSPSTSPLPRQSLGLFSQAVHPISSVR